MSSNLPSFSGGVPSGATMRPQYMGRMMTTYPISEPELDNISTLNAQVTVRFAVASSLFALACGIWTNAIFATAMTPAGELASKFVAPLLLVFSIGYAVAAFISRRNRKSAWEKIKGEALPLMAEAGGMMISRSSTPTPTRGRN